MSKAITYRYVSIQDIDYVWPSLVDDLEDLSDRYKEDWRAKDVYRVLCSGDSWLYLIYSDEERIGFWVLEVVTSQFSRKKYLHVWVLCCDDIDLILESATKELDRIVDRIGADGSRLITQRLGWTKKLKSIFEVKTIIMTRDKENV